ncbi:hypothetical protein Ancab_003121 [Ancistrocladus abbreviatus]
MSKTPSYYGIAQELEYGQRLEKKKRMRSVNLKQYLKYRNEKLSQLKPIVLDDLTCFPSKIEEREVKKNARVECEEGGGVDGNESLSGDKWVEPRDPRRAVYGRNLDDIYSMVGTISLVKWLPLHSLAASGEFYLLNALLKHVSDINATDQDGLTALHKAIICKKQAITNYLLRELANPFVRDKVDLKLPELWFLHTSVLADDQASLMHLHRALSCYISVSEPSFGSNMCEDLAILKTSNFYFH